VRLEPVEAELAESVLLRCVAGDPDAFRAFVQRYEVAVFALVSRLLGRGPHVEDLAQETFLRAFRAFPRFDVQGPARVSTWLLTIGTHVARDHYRKWARSSAHSHELALAARAERTAPSPEQDSARRELGRAIQDAAAELPHEQRAAFVLAEFHDFTITEIARALAIPENTAKTRIFRARQKLAATLASYKDRP
jgi:RNA polymerase sigma-70 factor (ECF subfamily)